MGIFTGKIKAAAASKTLADQLSDAAASRAVDQEHEHWVAQDYTSKAHEAEVRSEVAAREAAALAHANAILNAAGVTL